MTANRQADNPYQVLGTTVPPLLGRGDLLREIEARLHQPDPQHVSVVGPAMYGKRVLLRELSRRFAVQGNGYLTAVYLDFRTGSIQDDAQLRQRVADSMRSALEKIRPDVAEYFELEGTRLEDRIQAVIQELAASGDRLLVILDGFDRVIANPGITQEIWDNLRSFARQPVGNFGQHQDDRVDWPFAVSVCYAAIALCHGLAADGISPPEQGQ